MNLRFYHPNKVIINILAFLYITVTKQVQLLATQKPILKRQVLVGKGKTALLRRPVNWREGRLISKNQLWRFCSIMKVSKARKWRSSFSELVSLHYPQLCANFFWLVGGEITGWCSRNLVLSLNLPSSIWLEVLDAAEEIKDIAMSIPWKRTRTLLSHHTLVFCCSFLVSAFSPFHDKCLHLTFETKGRAKKLNETLSYKWDTEDTERTCTWEDHRILFPFIASYIWESMLIILWLYRVSYGKHSLWKSG